jgi:hypothetical protein
MRSMQTQIGLTGRRTATVLLLPQPLSRSDATASALVARLTALNEADNRAVVIGRVGFDIEPARVPIGYQAFVASERGDAAHVIAESACNTFGGRSFSPTSEPASKRLRRQDWTRPGDGFDDLVAWTRRSSGQIQIGRTGRRTATGALLPQPVSAVPTASTAARAVGARI